MQVRNGFNFGLDKNTKPNIDDSGNQGNNTVAGLNQQPKPVIKKYERTQDGEKKDDEYYANPFVPANIQRNMESSKGATGGNAFSSLNRGRR